MAIAMTKTIIRDVTMMEMIAVDYLSTLNTAIFVNVI